MPDETTTDHGAAAMQAVEQARQELADAEDEVLLTDSTPTHEELFQRAREAVTALRSHTRKGGPIRPGEMLNLRHGLQSEKLIQQPDIAAWHREQVVAISADLGGMTELTTLQSASVREVARLEVILAAMGTELLENGVLTGKGNLKAATTVYLAVLDRFTRLCAVLGLERRARKVASLAEVMDGK